MYSLVSQLSHVEITTQKPNESLRFFVDVLEFDRNGASWSVGVLAGVAEFLSS